MELKDCNGRLEIDLPSLLDLPAASALRDALLEALARDASDVVLKASAVERTGTAAIQVLLAAAETFAATSRHLAMDAPSDSVSAAFRHLGLAADLDRLVIS